MDYHGTKFEFDLQLFGTEADITLPAIADRSGVLYFVKQVSVGENEYVDQWVKAADLATTKVKNGENEPRNVTAVDIAAKFDSAGARLDMVIEDETALTVKSTTVNTDVTVAVAKSFAAGTNDDYDPQGAATGSLVKGTVAFEGVDGLTVSVACADTTESAEVAASTVKISAAKVLTVSKDCVVTTAGKEYTAGSASAVMTLGTTSEGALDGTVTLTTGTASFKAEDAAVTVVTGESASQVANTITSTLTAGNKAITVTSAGALSYEPGATFTVKNGAADEDLTEYTTAANSIVVTGDRVGYYNTTGATGVSIAVATGTVTGTVDTQQKTLDPKELELTLHNDNAAAGADEKYALLADGTVVHTDVEISIGSKLKADGSAIDAESGLIVIGYFNAKTEWNDGSPKVSISFVGGEKTVEDEKVATVTSYLGKVAIDADAVKTITSSGNPQPLSVLAVDAISGTEKGVSVTKLYKDATTTGVEGTIAYLETYVLGTENSANSINLASLVSKTGAEVANGQYYFEITDTGSATENKGVHTYSIAQTGVLKATWDAANPAKTTSAFVVTKADDGYTITFVTGSANKPEHLTEECWAGIQVNATGADKAIVITSTTDDTHDAYAVKNIPNGISVTATDANVVREFAKYTYSFDSTSNGVIVLTNATSAASDAYYVVTSDKSTTTDGAVEITITEATNEQKTAIGNGTFAGSYLTVSTSKQTTGNVLGEVTISYTDGDGIPLAGLKDSDGKDVKLTINADNLTKANVSTLTFDALMKGNVAATVTNLEPGIAKVDTGAVATLDKETCPTGYLNKVAFDLTGLTDDTPKVVYIAAGDANDVRYSEIKVSETATNNFYTITQNTDEETGKKTIKVVYTKATDPAKAIDLGGALVEGKTQISAANDALITDVTIGANETLTNATASIETLTYGESATVVTSDFSGAESAGVISFVATAKFDGEIDLTGIASSSFPEVDGSKVLYFTVEKETAVKGVTVYTIEAVTGNSAPTDSSKNFFTAKYKDNTITLTYTPKSSGGVSAADLGKVGVIAFDGSTVPDGTTKLVLTKESDTADAIAYKVTGLPASVTTIENGTGTGDVIEYADTYKLADGASIALGSVTATTYYEVVVDSTVEAKYGVHTVKLQALTFDAKLSEEELTKEKAKHNFFTVDTNGSTGATTITYTVATNSDDKNADGSRKYPAYALTGTSTLNVDPTGAAKDAKIEIGDATDNADNVVYKVTGLSVGQTVGNATEASSKTVASLAGSTYAVSYEIEYTPDTQGDAGAAKYVTGKNILLTSETGKVYYQVVKAGEGKTKWTDTERGVVTYTVSYYGTSSAPASGNYIEVTNSATGFGVTVKYSGEDLSALTAAGKKFAINAAGAASTVSDIDLANTSGTIAYALTNVGAGVTVKNAGANDEYAAQTAITLSDTLALGGETALATYYIVGADGKLTAAATKPGTDSNYLSVTKNDDGTSYTVAYTKATTGTAYSLKPDSELKVKAADISETASAVTVKFDDGIKNTITGAKGNVTPSAETGSNFTISYTTKFAWAAGTYFVPTKEADGTTAVTTLDLASATTVTTDPTDTSTEYNKVVVSVAKDGTYSIEISVLKNNDATGVIDTAGSNAAVKIIDVTPATSAAAITKFNATGLASGTEVKGFATGAYVTNVPDGVKVTGAGKLTVNAGTAAANDKVFNASTGNITVVYSTSGSAFKGVDGVFLVGKTAAAFEGSANGSNGDYISVQVTSTKSSETGAPDNNVAVTFEGGVIKSISGLDVGEEVRVVQKDSTNKTYKYTIDEDGTVTRTDVATGKPEVAGGDGTGVNIVGLDYVAEGDLKVAMADKTFDWTQRGTAQYFTIGSNGTVAIPSDGYTAEGKQVAKDTNYVRLVVEQGTPAALTMDVVKGSTLGTVSENPDFAGTISITAPASAISYTKTAANKFAVKLTNVAAGSVISGMDTSDIGNNVADVTGDTITTAAIAAGKAVTVDGSTYTAAVAGTVLSFTDGKLTSTGEGGLTVTSASGAIALANGSTVESAGAAVKVAVTTKDGATSITEISGLANAETVTVTDADGNTTLYEGTPDAKKVNVTVTTVATGDVSKYTLTLTADNGNVIGITPALAGYTNAFEWADGKSGYFAVGMNSSDAGTYNKATVKKDTSTSAEFTENAIYIEASVTKDASGPAVLTLTAKKFDGTQLTTEGVNTGDYTITVHADESGNGTGTANKIAYNGTGSNFKLVVDGVAKDSVFTNVYKGSTITTASLTAANNDAVVINGRTYTAAADGAFTFFTTSRSAANLVTGTVMVTDELTASAEGGTGAVTLAYTAGTAADSKDGMKVKYDAGVLQYIKGAGVGEKLTITDADGKVTTYEVLADAAGSNVTAFRQDSEGAVTYVTVTDASTDIAGTKTGDFAAPATTKFAWSDAKDATLASGVFAISDNAVTVGNQSAATAITYKNYGAAYVAATYAAGGTLTLTKQTVGATGALANADFASTDAVTVSAEGKTISYTARDTKMGSLYLENVGDGSVIASTVSGSTVTNNGWTNSDKVTTAALPTAGTSKVTVGGKVFTAGTANTKLTIAGFANTYDGDTHAITGKSTIPTLTEGAVLVSGTTGATTELWTRNVSNDKTVTEQHVTYNYNTWSTTASQNLVVTVLGGEISSITGFDAEEGAAEKFTIDTYTTTSTGKTTLSTAAYTAEYVTEGAKKGQILVTKVEDGVTSTRYFSNNTLNIVDKTLAWAPTNQVTKQDFDWDKTGYFLTTVPDSTKPTVYAASIATQNGATTIQGKETLSDGTVVPHETGKIYLEITSTMDTSGVATISNMRLVKVNEDGTFADVAATNTIGTVTVDASATKGIKFEENDTAALAITGAVAGSVFTGLNAADTVTGTFTGAGVVTVGDTRYNVATTDKFTITGENTITEGVFTVTETENPVKSSVTATKLTGALDTSMKYSSTATTPDGVKVTFGATGITSVTDLNAGETVVVTDSDGGTRTFAAAADSANSANTILTQTIDFADTTAPANLVLKSGSAAHATVAGYNALSMSYYKAANKFDFGATETTGQMGIFKVAPKTTTIAAQDDASLTANAFDSTDASFVLVGATKGTSGYTINHLEVLAYDYTDANNSTLKRKKASDATVGDEVTSIAITAPTDGGITLGDDAVKLYTKYTTNDKGEIVIDETATETGRTYGINVKAAQAGMTYSGFNELDTIATSGTLAEGKTLTVDGVTYTAASSSEVVIRGDGKAVDGVFAIGSGLSGASSTDVVAVTSTGAADAIVTFEDGKIAAINGLKTTDQQVTITQTNIATGAITTTTYKVTAVTDDGLTVERAITKDGITTTTTSKTPIALIDSVTDGTYANATATLSSKFDWTAAGGAGYFLTEITDTLKELGTNLTVETQNSEVKGEAGKYYLKVALSADGVVSGVTLHKVNTDGTLAANSLSSVTAGTINIVASTKANIDIKTFDGLQNAVKVSITGAAAESTVANMRAGDLFMTTTLKKDDTVNVSKTGDASTTTYTVGADGFLKFQNTAQLVEGTVKFTEDTAADGVMTGDVAKFAVDVLGASAATGATADTVLVKVLGGKVTAVSGLTTAANGTVTVTDTNNNAVAYSASETSNLLGVNVATPTKTAVNIETMALSEGGAIKLNNASLGYTAGAAGAMKFYATSTTSLALVTGAIQFSADGNATITSDGTTTTAIAVDVGTASPDIDINVKDGAVISVTGLKAGESVTIGAGASQVKYSAKSATVIEKTVGTGDTAETTTAYLTTAGGDVISAKYQAVDSSTDISEETNAIEGQLSWADVSGRSTGYFEVKSDKATIAEQTAKVTVKAPKNTATKDNSVTYAVANAATDEDNNKRQTLTIGALKVTTDTAGKTTVTGTDAAELLSGATLTVTAPATKVTLADGSEIVPALDYTKSATDTFHIVLNKVAAGSVISSLEAGDKMTTAVLAAPTTADVYESVKINGQDYAAGAKGTLEFLGETTSTTVNEVTTKTNVMTLLNGTVVLNNTYPSATLSGSKTASESGAGDDITVSVSAVNPDDESEVAVYNDVAVTVKNGQVTGITGLYQAGAIVTVAPTGGTQVTYRVLQSEYSSTSKTYTTLVSRTEGTGESAVTYFGTFTDKKSVYATSSTSSSGVYSVTNGYKPVGTDTATNVDVIWSATTATPVYVAEGKTFAKGEAGTIKAATAERGKEYDVMTVKTGANGITTISKIERMAVNAQGVPAAVKGATVDAATIDGTITAASGNTEGTYAKISYRVPTTMALTAKNVGLGSVFTGLGDDDFVTTATDSGTFTFGTDGTSVTVYKEKEGFGTETTVYTSKTKGVVATMADDKLTISNFTSGSLSVVSTTKDKGKVTTDYVYDSKGVLTKTVTDVNGAKEVYALDTTDAGVADDLTGFKFAANPTIGQVVSDFDWTLAKNQTGYFAIANGKATAKVAKTTIKNAASNYIAVTLSDNGVISDISQRVFDAAATGDDHGMKEVTDPTFSGTIAITAPSKLALTFDRNALNVNSIDATAKVAVTGAVAYSAITSLKEGDTVTTARLAIANAKTYTPAQSVHLSVDGGDVATFTAGAAGALSFAVANVDNGTRLTLTGGTIAMSKSDTDAEGVGFAYVGSQLVTMEKGNVTIAAKTSNGKTTFTVGGLDEGESFSVEDFAAGTTRTYTKSSTTLFCKTVSDSGTTLSVYTLGTKTSIASTALLPTANGWTTYGESNAAFTDTEDGKALVSGKAVTVNLANLDKRRATDKKTSTAGYEFVIDKYMAAPTKFNGVASVIDTDNYVDVQQIVGQVAVDYVYQAYGTDGAIAQAIAAADKWAVYGSAAADTITGASKGTDTLIGNAGNDTLVGGNANDTFAFTLTDSGKDEVTKYTTGKDKIVVSTNNDGTYTEGEAVSLANIALVASQSGRNAADVLLHDGTYDEATGEADNSVLLSGMGNGKAVTINDATYYFGNAATKKAMTFTYTEGAYYLADASANTAKAGNTINVTTDKTKATAKTLGDTVTVNLADTEHYVGIKAVNAKSSGNRVYLAAGDTGATLTGGTYQSTLAGGAGSDSLVGGSGSDVFWFDTVEGTDTVTSYTSGKDSVYLGDFNSASATANTANGLTIKADGKNVVINNGDTGEVTLANAVSATKAVTVLADKDDKTLLSYYVGSAASKAKNNFTATLGTDAEIGTDAAKTVSLTSYYLGTETANAVDTLSIKTAKGQKTAVNGKFSLASNAAHLSNIDVLDTSAINIAGSKVTLQGSNSGSFTLKGTNGTKNVTDRFDLSNLEAGAKQVTLTNLDVGEIIELAGNRKLEGSGTSWSITDDSGEVYGTVTLTGASKNAAFTKGTTTDGHVTYTRSVK